MAMCFGGALRGGKRAVEGGAEAMMQVQVITWRVEWLTVISTYSVMQMVQAAHGCEGEAAASWCSDAEGCVMCPPGGLRCLAG